tara:strand:- start:88930 stop:90834 length:1905 start_codon:yes stop_codon:yes gene_type:complete
MYKKINLLSLLTLISMSTILAESNLSEGYKKEDFINENIESSKNSKWDSTKEDKHLNSGENKSNLIKWEVVPNSKGLKKESINWEKQKENGVKIEILKAPLKIEERLSISHQEEYNNQLNFNFLNLGPALPTANTLNEGDQRISFSQVSPITEGAGGGTGNQNYFLYLDYGATNELTLTTFYTHADDDLHNNIDTLDPQPGNRWISYGAGFKWKKIDSKNFKLSLAGSIEKWDVKSGGCNLYNCVKSSKNIFNSSLDEVSNSNVIGSIALPISWHIYEPLEITLAPKFIFLPDTQGNNNGSGEFYGNNFGVGLGMTYKPFSKLSTFSSAFIPLGSGNNSFNNKLLFQKNIIYTSGINYVLDPNIAFEGYLSNSFGGSPSTGILSIPSGNDILYGARLIYTPTNLEIPNSTQELEESDFRFGGISVSSADQLNFGEKRVKAGIDSRGSLWSRLDWSISNLFSVDLSSTRIEQQSDDPNHNLSNSYHNISEIMIRAGGQATLFSQDRGDFFTNALRVSAGRARGIGWYFTEMLNTYKATKNLKFNLNPKIAFSGYGNAASIGTSINLKLNKYIYLIPEANFAVKEAQDNWTFAIRYIPFDSKFIDIYTTNSLNFMDVGQLFRSEDQRFGINIGSIF